MPTLTQNNSAYGGLAHFALNGYLGLCLAFAMLFPYLANIVRRELDVVRDIWEKVAHSPFLQAVFHIRVLITHKQMVWAQAGRIIAAMQNAQPFRDGTDGQNVSLPMHQKFLIFIPGLQLAIAVCVLAARPFHAGIILRDFLKKLFQQSQIGQPMRHVFMLAR